MSNFKYGAIGAAGLALLFTVATAAAQETQPTRVRGTIEKVDGATPAIKTREGPTVTVKLTDNAVHAAAHLPAWQLAAAPVKATGPGTSSPIAP